MAEAIFSKSFADRVLPRFPSRGRIVGEARRHQGEACRGVHQPRAPFLQRETGKETSGLRRITLPQNAPWKRIRENARTWIEIRCTSLCVLFVWCAFVCECVGFAYGCRVLCRCLQFIYWACFFLYDGLEFRLDLCWKPTRAEKCCVGLISTALAICSGTLQPRGLHSRQYSHGVLFSYPLYAL